MTKIASRMKRECQKEEDKKKKIKKKINISTMSILFNLMRTGQYLKSDK